VENIFLWGQAMLILSDVMACGLVTPHDIDPIRRALPSSARPKSGHRYSSFEVRVKNSTSQLFVDEL
jgi:hypothetical protein